MLESVALNTYLFEGPVIEGLLTSIQGERRVQEEQEEDKYYGEPTAIIHEDGFPRGPWLGYVYRLNKTEYCFLPCEPIFDYDYSYVLKKIDPDLMLGPTYKNGEIDYNYQPESKLGDLDNIGRRLTQPEKDKLHRTTTEYVTARHNKAFQLHVARHLRIA